MHGHTFRDEYCHYYSNIIKFVAEKQTAAIMFLSATNTYETVGDISKIFKTKLWPEHYLWDPAVSFVRR